MNIEKLSQANQLAADISLYQKCEKTLSELRESISKDDKTVEVVIDGIAWEMKSNDNLIAFVDNVHKGIADKLSEKEKEFKNL